MAKKKVVKPTGFEQAQIDKALRRKHPYMLTETWIQRLSKKVRKELERRRASKSYQLAKTGMTKKEITRMGVKL